MSATLNMTEEQETPYQAAQRLLILAEHASRRITKDGAVLGHTGLMLDLEAIRLIVERLEACR